MRLICVNLIFWRVACLVTIYSVSTCIFCQQDLLTYFFLPIIVFFSTRAFLYLLKCFNNCMVVYFFGWQVSCNGRYLSLHCIAKANRTESINRKVAPIEQFCEQMLPLVYLVYLFLRPVKTMSMNLIITNETIGVG